MAWGQDKEYPYIKDLIPVFGSFMSSHFYGGGAIFFQLQPKEAVNNDVSTELTDFYSLLKVGKQREEFKRELYDNVDNWEKFQSI
jgi:DNA adenine methylase